MTEELVSGERSDVEPNGGSRSGELPTSSPSEEPVPEAAPYVPDPEVSARPTRRRFTEQYKQKIVREADTCAESGAIGSLLRREGLYSSLLGTWRKQRDKRELQAFAPQKRGRKPAAVNPMAKQLAQEQRANRDLQRQLKKAHLMLDLQKKVSELLGISLEPMPSEENE